MRIVSFAIAVFAVVVPVVQASINDGKDDEPDRNQDQDKTETKGTEWSPVTADHDTGKLQQTLPEGQLLATRVMDLMALGANLQAKIQMYHGVQALYEALSEVGAMTVLAAMRVAVLSALAELLSRSSQQTGDMVATDLETSQMITTVMDALKDPQ